MLPSTTPYRQRNLPSLPLHELDVHLHMTNVFLEGATRTGDGDESRLDLDGDTLRHVEFLSLHDVLHL